MNLGLHSSDLHPFQVLHAVDGLFGRNVTNSGIVDSQKANALLCTGVYKEFSGRAVRSFVEMLIAVEEKGKVVDDELRNEIRYHGGS